MFRKSHFKTLLNCGVAAVALTTTNAWGQDQEAQVSRIEEITVTARRVEENIQKVPVSIVAISEDKLRTVSVLNIADLSKVSPGLWAQYPNGSFV